MEDVFEEVHKIARSWRPCELSTSTNGIFLNYKTDILPFDVFNSLCFSRYSVIGPTLFIRTWFSKFQAIIMPASEESCLCLCWLFLYICRPMTLFSFKDFLRPLFFFLVGFRYGIWFATVFRLNLRQSTMLCLVRLLHYRELKFTWNNLGEDRSSIIPAIALLSLGVLSSFELSVGCQFRANLVEIGQF